MTDYNLTFNGKQWILRRAKSLDVIVAHKTKADALYNITNLLDEFATPEHPFSLRIHLQTGRFQEERTYPQSTDPPQTPG